jgi:FkbH-like protein
MKITAALRVLQAAPTGAPEFVVTLACGFTALHLQTFLGAHLQQALDQRSVRIDTGLFGDLAGALEAVVEQPAQAVAVAIEWPDVDGRLGYRHLGGWGPADIRDISANCGRALDRIRLAIERIPAGVKVVISLPTLPLPPAFHTFSWQASAAELELRCSLAGFARCVGLLPNVLVLNEARLAEVSPPAGRFDLKSELLTGLPYTIPHADALGAALAGALLPQAPKKGLITDLDDTLWSGIVGETGPASVTWDLTSHTQLHGLYQQLLRALAERGVLIGIASRNDAAVVEQVFARSDILLPLSKVFPIEVHWEPKSGSVERILRAWNIGADSVVFLDDSPMELAEVKAAHPDIECIQFPKSDYPGAYDLLRRLGDLFGKSKLVEEDSIRLDSLRQGSAFRQVAEEGGGQAPEEFLAQAKATILLDFRSSNDFRSTGNSRTLELVNKTNQFNLNGVRYTDAEWGKQLETPGAFLLVVGYQDKFGPLGKIAVLQGRCEGNTLHVGTWVMSCRAFARRIEHCCIDALFRRFPVEEVRFSFAPTSRNGPLRRFLSEMLGAGPETIVTLPRERFLEKRPKLYHTVNEHHG